MGCSNSKNTEITEPGNGGKPLMHKSTPQTKDVKHSDEEDIYINIDDAVAYVQQELDMAGDRALRLVYTVSTNDDGKVSSVELVMLNDRIKEIKDTLGPKFATYDKNQTGYVTPDNAINILAAEFTGIPITSLRVLINQYDKDNNNMVDFTEFVEFYACIKAKAAVVGKKFEELDGDKSGDLDADELVTLLMKECAIEEFQARSLIRDFDVDSNGCLDKNEFLTLWMKLFTA